MQSIGVQQAFHAVVDLKKRNQDSLKTRGVGVTSGAGSRKKAHVQTATIQFLHRRYGDARGETYQI